MTPHLVQWLQIIAGIAWGLPAAKFARNAWRTIRGRANLYDTQRCLCFFIAVDQIGFTVRWLVWPRSLPAMGDAELSTWTALYATSALCAVALAIAGWLVERPR